jgi:hypothetical protein
MFNNSKKTQVVGCRLHHELYNEYETRCIEMQTTMSNVIRNAVNEFMQVDKNALRTSELLNTFAKSCK